MHFAEVVMQEQRRHYQFLDKSVGRDVFLADFKMHIAKVLTSEPGKPMPIEEVMHLSMFFTEIAKNIFDHAEGEGEAKIAKNPDNVLFLIKDYGKKSFDLDEIKKRNSSKKGDKTNRESGISFIESYAEHILHLEEFKIDTQEGFCYSGKYIRKA